MCFKIVKKVDFSLTKNIDKQLKNLIEFAYERIKIYTQDNYNDSLTVSSIQMVCNQKKLDYLKIECQLH